MSQRFEGSYLANPGALAEDARLECGICWTVYDPKIGDMSNQIPPGTPFARLPEGWHCPSCDAPKEKFMLLDRVADQGGADVVPLDRLGQLRARVEALESAFKLREARMRDLPIYNGLLRVEAVGARLCGDDVVCVLISPWFMNIIVMPLDPARAQGAPEGSKRDLRFPSGDYETIVGRLDGVGYYDAISLFSPMFEFSDQAVARTTAEAAADGLFEAPPAPPSRRAMLAAAHGHRSG
ncbi:MAG: [NiFe]-hydrogenase assembly chaperone HybE [Lysobacterales bacterium]